MTILEALKSFTSYPIPASTITMLAGKRDLVTSETFTSDVARSHAFRLTEADIYAWLSKAPNVSEGGVSFSFSTDEKARFLALCDLIYSEFEEKTAKFGYKGEYL